MIVGRYLDQDTWKKKTVFTEESVALLQDILEEAGELTERVPYDQLVNVKYAEEAAK